LLYPEDAKDASQEILIKIITHLSTFEGRSKFQTWVYRVASNYLLTHKGKLSQNFAMSFDAYAQQIDTGQLSKVAYTQNEGEILLLEEEVKVSCTQGLLLCLKPISRMVYVLGVILEMNSREGAAVLEITPEGFRKQLSRSKTKIRHFLEKKCGLVNPDNLCRCKRKIDFLANQKIIDPAKLRFANINQRSIELFKNIQSIEKSVALYQSNPNGEMPSEVITHIRQMIRSV